MAWARKNETFRLYYERLTQSYLLVDVSGTSPLGNYSAIGSYSFGSSKPSLASTGVAPSYLRNRCKRVSWDELPRQWQQAFRRWLNVKPKDVRGFWRLTTVV